MLQIDVRVAVNHTHAYKDEDAARLHGNDEAGPPAGVEAVS